jgi:hypothetical protein
MVVVIGWIATCATAAHAIRFGQNDAVELRGRIYSQFTVATEQSQIYTQPSIDPGNLKQWRNFYNPELEVDFRKLTGWRGFFDQLSGRLAIWGFYDGIYDFGPERYRQVLAKEKQPGVESAFYSHGYSYEQALDNTGARRDGREYYGRRTRVNEAYLNLAKGPFFMRIGRQAISWGEADTIGLLDANNPFDILLTPGVQIDLDESRIPLWTVRSTYALFDHWGPLSSGFIDAYWVPGWLDTNVGYLPIASASPYAQPPPLQPAGIQVFDKQPRYELGNSRYGFKLQAVINRDYNASLWFYRTFQTVPVPVLAGISDGGKYITTVLNHGLTNVIGGAMSWYSPTIDSVVRSELELFNDEPAFLAYKGIGAVVDSGFAPGVRGQYDVVNVLRGELGIDKNFFLPMINPSASFLAIVDLVFMANLDENSERDYRSPLIKPSAVKRQVKGGTLAGQVTPKWCDDQDIDVPPELRQCDFINQEPFDAFLQTTIRSDFAGGIWQPGVTAIATLQGALMFAPSVLYRWSDSLLFDVKYINTHTFGSGNSGYTQGVGLLRDGDQIWFRATYQLN